jgi:hypothetical protein
MLIRGKVDKTEKYLAAAGLVAVVGFLAYITVTTFVFDSRYHRASRDLDYSCYNFARLGFMAGNFEAIGSVPAGVEAAYAGGTVGGCDALEAEECRNACYLAVAEKIAGDGREACERIESFSLGGEVFDDTIRQTGCYIHLAIVTGNRTYCSLLTPVNGTFDESFCLGKIRK